MKVQRLLGRWFVVIAITIVGVCQPVSIQAAAGAKEIDRILVVVNDDVITQNEFQSQLNTIKRQLKLSRQPVPPDDVLRKQVLDRMIMDKLQLQLAKRSGISADPKEVDQAIAEIARRNHLTTAQLHQALERDGIKVGDFRTQIETQITIRKLIGKEINNRVTVTDSEVDNFLLTYGKKAKLGTEFNVSHILVGIPNRATPDVIEAARKRVQDLHRRLQTGLSFERAAVEYSQGPEALQGGRLGWKKIGELPDIFVSALSSMKVGEISDVLRGNRGFHIIKLNQRRGGGTQSVVQTHARHILIRPSVVISVEEAKRRLAKIRERILNGEDFGELAKAHSNDTGSSVKGGDLGWVSPGALGPELEKVMNSLEPEQISQPVQTRYGVHLVQVLGRRRQDVGDERRRDLARKQIHQRKARELYEQWLRQLRDEAYIEYRTEEAY